MRTWEVTDRAAQRFRERVTTGLPVVYMSGRTCGSVGRIDGESFELLRDGGGRLWLPWDAVFTVDSRLTLVCEQQGLERLAAA